MLCLATMMYHLHYSSVHVYLVIAFIAMKLLNAKLSMLRFSRMVRPGPRGRGRGANFPPPLEYMAGMMQQFELNRQFMEKHHGTVSMPQCEPAAQPGHSARLCAAQPNY